MTRTDFFKQAINIVLSRRQRAISLSQKKLVEVYEKIPQMLTLDNEILALNAKNAICLDKDRKNGLLQKLQELQQERKDLLSQNSLTSADLEPEYKCAFCSDSGRFKGKTCFCVFEEAKKLSRAQIVSNTPLSLCSFKSFSLSKYSKEKDAQHGVSPYDTMSAVLTYCKQYVKKFTPHNKSILMLGDAGLGKTHLALSIASEVIDSGADVVYVSAAASFAALERERFTAPSDLFSSMLEADLLILDDLGAEFLTPYITSMLYNLINTRMNSKLSTIYTTNITNEEMLFARYTEKIASRLLGSCTILHFMGEDIRLMEK